MIQFERLDGGAATWVVAVEETGAPRLVYFGAGLPPDSDLTALDAALAPTQRGAAPDVLLTASLAPTPGAGYMGEPAVSGARVDGACILTWESSTCTREGDALRMTLRDSRQSIRVVLDWRLDARTGVLAARSTLHNDGADAFQLDQLAAIYLPLPGWARDIGFLKI